MKALITLFNNGNNSFGNKAAYVAGSANFWKLVDYSYSSFLKEELLKSFTNNDFDFEHDKYLKYVMDEDGRHYVVFHAMNEISFEIYTVENHVVYQFTGESIDLYEKGGCTCEMKKDDKTVSMDDVANTAKAKRDNPFGRNAYDFNIEDLFDAMHQIYENGKDTIFTKENIGNTLKLMQKFLDFENEIGDHLANNKNENKSNENANNENKTEYGLNDLFNDVSKASKRLYDLYGAYSNYETFKRMLSDLLPKSTAQVKNDKSSEASKDVHKDTTDTSHKAPENDFSNARKEFSPSHHTVKYVFHNDLTGKHVELTNKNGKYYINSFNVPEEVYEKALKYCSSNDTVDKKIDNILGLYNDHVSELFYNPF